MSYDNLPPEDPKLDWWANQIMIWGLVLWLTIVIAKIYNG